MELLSVGYVHLFEFNTPVSDAETLRKAVDIVTIANDDIALFGVSYQARVLQSNNPDVSPWLMVSYSTVRNERSYWNGDSDMKEPGLIHAKSFTGIPAYGEAKVLGGYLTLAPYDTLHITATIENLDPNAVFNKTVRLQTTLFYQFKKNLMSQEVEKWKSIFAGVR